MNEIADEALTVAHIKSAQNPRRQFTDLELKGFLSDFIGVLTVHVDNLPRRTVRNDLLAHLQAKYNPTRIRLVTFRTQFSKSSLQMFEDDKNRAYAFVTFPTAREFTDVLKDHIQFHGCLRISAARADKVHWKLNHKPGMKKGYFPVGPGLMRCTSCQNAFDDDRHRV